jgi:hypothetical protein
MDSEDKLDQQTERYVHKRMNEAERTAFELQMQDNPLLKKEVEELILLKNDFDKDLFDFKKKLLAAKDDLQNEGFFKEVAKPSAKIKSIHDAKKMRAWWAVAASVILLVGLVYFYNAKPDYNQLAMTAALNDFPQMRGVEDELDSLFNAGAYQRYIDEAILLTKDSIPSEKKEQLIVNIVSSYILLNDPVKANTFLANTTAEIKNNCMVRYAQVLVLIQLKEKEKAIKQLTSFINDKCYPLDNEAKSLKKKLE